MQPFKTNRSKASRPLFTIGLLVCFVVGNAPSLSARDDWQYWNEFALKARVVEKTHLQIKGGQRLREDFSELFLANVDVGIFYRPSRYFEFGPAYKFESEKSLAGVRTSENRLILETTLKYPRGNLEWSDRNRVEYRNISGAESWRYRNRFRVSYAIPVKKIDIVPFVSEEIFYDTVPDQLNQNRITMGLEFMVHRNFGIQLYYLLRSKKSGSDWSQSHILGTGLSISV